jgi:hypothetical protein
LTREDKLWKVWWIAGIPVAWLVVGLVLLAEGAHSAGYRGAGDLLEVTQFLIYFAWFRLAWRASRNIGHSILRPAAQGVLATGLVFSAMF